jgi:hypothetical protein
MLSVDSVDRLSCSLYTLLLLSKFDDLDYVRCFGVLVRYVAQDLIFGLKKIVLWSC